MALENITQIEEALGIESGKFSEMINSEEKHIIDLDNLVIQKKEVYDERVSNIKKEASQMAKEITIKNIKKTFELDFEGKTEENLIGALQSKIVKEKENAITDPEKRYTDLKSDFEKLQGNLTAKEIEFNAFKQSIETTNLQNEIKNEFTKYIPDNVLVSKSTLFTEAKEKGFSFEKEDGKVIVKLNGEVQKDDKTLSPISVQSFVNNFVTPFLPNPQGGTGAKDEGGNAVVGSLEAFEKEAEKNNWTSSEKNKQMQKRIADGTLKI